MGMSDKERLDKLENISIAQKKMVDRVENKRDQNRKKSEAVISSLDSRDAWFSRIEDCIISLREAIDSDTIYEFDVILDWLIQYEKYKNTPLIDDNVRKKAITNIRLAFWRAFHDNFREHHRSDKILDRQINDTVFKTAGDVEKLFQAEIAQPFRRFVGQEEAKAEGEKPDDSGATTKTAERDKPIKTI